MGTPSERVQKRYAPMRVEVFDTERDHGGREFPTGFYCPQCGSVWGTTRQLMNVVCMHYLCPNGCNRGVQLGKRAKA